MTIDTDKVVNWVGMHLSICVPIACAALSWYAAVRWQVAIDKNQLALMIFYFSLSLVSGVTAAVLTLVHLNKLGFFGD